jgi:hypothetical protein
MAEVGKSREVVRALVHHLHKGGFGVKKARWAQNTMNLGNDAVRVKNVLEDSLNHDPVARSITEW